MKICSKRVSADAEKYHQFCKIHHLKQLIQFLTEATCSTVNDHILARFPLRVYQKGVKNVGLFFAQEKLLHLK